MAVFPKEFVWGAATAAYQIEGGAVEDGKGRSIWDVFSHTPGCTYRGETGDTACDSYHRWREDIELLKSMHLKAYRFSVAWTRIAPTGGTDWNEKGFAYYDGLVNTLLEAGIEPYITLYHWDLPQALEEKGGWRSEETARAFASYAAKMAEHFKGRVHQWFTFNEPACIVKMGYGTGEHAPGLKLPLEGQFTCWRNVIYAHCLAAQELRHGNANFTASTKSTGDMVKALSAPMLFDYMAIVMDKQALADRDFTMNVILPDVGEQHMLRVKNGVLLVYADTLSDDADVSITCPKNALFAILTNNQETVAKAVKVEGSAELLTLMMENMNQFPITGSNPFNIIEP